MGDRYRSQPLRTRERDRDGDASEIFSRAAPAPLPLPRSQVRLKIPDSVIDDDGSDTLDESSRHSNHKSHYARDENGAPDRPALRRRKSVDLERKTSRQNEEFRRRRDALEAQEAGAMRRAEDVPRRFPRKGEIDDGRYEERGKGRDRRDDRDRDGLGRGGEARRDDGGRTSDRDRRNDGARRSDRYGREDGMARDHGGGRHHHHEDRKDYERRREGDDGVSSDHGGRRHHSDGRRHEHRREKRDGRDEGLRRDDDGRREDGSRRGGEPRRGDDFRRGDESRRGGEARRGDDRESEPRRHRRRDVPDGLDAISDAVSYGSDPIEQAVSRDDGEWRKQSFPRSEDVLDLDQLLGEAQGGGGARPERDARERDLRPISPTAYDQTRSKRSARDPEDGPRRDKSGYYDSYGSAKERSIRPADWDDRRDRERR